MSGLLKLRHLNPCRSKHYTKNLYPQIARKINMERARKALTLRMYMLCTGRGRRNPMRRMRAATLGDRLQPRKTGSMSCIAAGHRRTNAVNRFP